jgi:hypothetical protein
MKMPGAQVTRISALDFPMVSQRRHVCEFQLDHGTVHIAWVGTVSGHKFK